MSGDKNMNHYQKEIEYLYLGILNNYSELKEEKAASLIYDFNCNEYEELISKYHFDDIIKGESDFTKACSLLHYLAPKLYHSSFYDNHIECNSLKLLEYSFENKEHGINCLNKSKILSEILLAFNIYARRVFIHPFSPFDFDSHVVVEMFDKSLNKWIMIDPTTDGYFVDENNIPLSMIEIRNNFISNKFQTFIASNSRSRDLNKQKVKNEEINLYFMKNCFLISFEEYNGFSKKEGEAITLLPLNYSIIKNQELNHKFRIENMPSEYKDLLPAQEKYLKEIKYKKEPIGYKVSSIYKSPIIE